jgi:hypothetical protein
MPLLWKDGGLVWYNGGLAYDEDLCDCECGEGISACGCGNLPTTLYLYASDGTFLTELVYTTAMANIAGTPPGWEMDYDGGTVEFYCIQVTLGGGTVEERWYIDDQEGGVTYVVASNCSGVLATFTGTLMGDVYVSTEPPP